GRGRNFEPVRKRRRNDGLAFALSLENRFKVVLFGDGDHVDVLYGEALNIVNRNAVAQNQSAATANLDLTESGGPKLAARSSQPTLRLTSSASAPTLECLGYENPRHRRWRTRARSGLEAPAIAASHENLLRAGQRRDRGRGRVRCGRCKEPRLHDRGREPDSARPHHRGSGVAAHARRGGRIHAA